MATCILCGFEDEEIVSHINTAHPKWNVQKFLMFFPFSRVVSPAIYSDLETAVHFGRVTDAVRNIPEGDRESIISANESQALVRSDISVGPDHE